MLCALPCSPVPRLTAIWPIFALHAVGFPQVRSLIGRSSMSFLGSLHLQPGLTQLTVGNAAWRKKSPDVLVYGVCVDRADCDESIPSTSNESAGYRCCASGIEPKTASVLYSYSRHWDRAHRRPFGQHPPSYSDEHSNVCKGQTATMAAWEHWSPIGQHKVRDRVLMVFWHVVFTGQHIS